MNQELPKPLMLLVALGQGGALFLLYRSMENQTWPHEQPLWLVPMATFLLAVPVFFLMLVRRDILVATTVYVLLYALLMVALATYIGWQLEPVQWVEEGSLLAVFGLTVAIASFKFLLYAQQLSSVGELRYPEMFLHSWRNFLVLGLSLLFVLIFMGILQLWGALFYIIGIGFFEALFESHWFLFPAGCTALAFAIIIFRNLSNITGSIAAILQALIRFLLPLLVVVSVSFMLALPFTGLAPLYDTGLGSGLLLWLQALTLFFVNAVYQGEVYRADNRDLPYPIVVHRLVYVGVAILPVYSLIAFYGLLLRIDQYGLTVQRGWALLVAVLLFLFTLGYLWSIARLRDRWLQGLAHVNIHFGMILALVLVLVNTPLLNFHKMSASSQLNRLEDGEITLQELDLTYLRNSLGRHGYLALEEVKQRYGEDNPVIVASIDRLYRDMGLERGFGAGVGQRVLSPQQLRDQLQVWPQGRSLAPELEEAILAQTGPYLTRFGDAEFYLLYIDLNEDGQEETVFIASSTQTSPRTPMFPGFVFATLWTMENGNWRFRPLSTIGALDVDNINAQLRQDQVEILEPEWNDLRIGELVIRVQPFDQLGPPSGVIPGPVGVMGPAIRPGVP